MPYRLKVLISAKPPKHTRKANGYSDTQQVREGEVVHTGHGTFAAAITTTVWCAASADMPNMCSFIDRGEIIVSATGRHAGGGAVSTMSIVDSCGNGKSMFTQVIAPLPLLFLSPCGAPHRRTGQVYM